MIYTARDSQAQILRDIWELHLKGKPYHADLTYSTGAFWHGEKPPRIAPPIRMDLLPGGNVQGDIRALPFRDASLESAVVDLPFVHAPGKDSIMGKRFSGYPSQKALDELHAEAARELYRVLKPKGILVWKCQDIVESGKSVWNHVLIIQHCLALGFILDDLFILVRKNVMTGWNQKRQLHARKNHSYFLVFKRPNK